MSAPSNISAAAAHRDRRLVTDRRTRTLRALVAGNFSPRRLGPRRARDGSLASTDLHDARWLAVAVAILSLSAADALLTLTLMQHGVRESNPVMASLMSLAPYWFIDVKVGLTAAAVLLLTMLAKVRAFGWLPVGWLLYGALAVYVALIGYEAWLLRIIAKL